MKEASYDREIVVSASPDGAYSALTAEIGKWWVVPEGGATAVGDTPVFRFGPTYWKMRIKEIIWEERIVWECIAANHIDQVLPPGAQDEWVGTTLKWDINRMPEGTRIRLVHEGLSPALKCYETCKKGWDYFFVESLQEYLNSGEGKPFKSITV